MKHLAFSALATIALMTSLCGFTHAAEHRRPAQMVTVGKVSQASETVRRNLAGVIVSPAMVKLTPKVSAEIEAIGFTEGGYVKKGQLLYQLDPVKYDAEVKSAEAKIAQCKAKLAYAQTSYNRKKSLHEKAITTKDAVDNALSTLDALKAELDAAEADLIAARDDLKSTKITAPISGQIGVTNFTPGNYLTASSDTLATIVQTDPLRVRFTISNRDFLTMFSNQKDMKANAEISILLADDKIYDHKGKIEFVNNLANQNTDSIQVYAQFPNPEQKLIPGSIVTVELQKKESSSVAAVLPSAVMHDSKGAYVYVVGKDSKVERRDVILASATDDLQLVSKGLSLGETVVTDGMNKIMPGAQIIPDFQTK